LNRIRKSWRRNLQRRKAEAGRGVKEENTGNSRTGTEIKE
jgi:hypothetical protein